MTKIQVCRFFLLAFVLAATSATSAAQLYSVLYDLGTNSGDPQSPQGHFAQARDGNLYSTSPSGGSNGYGTVFQLTPAGKMKVLWSFTGVNSQGGDPVGGLTLGTDGNLYGTTIADGTDKAGTVFKITTAGKLTVLHNFTGLTDGSNAVIAPVQGTDGNFYGAASNGISYYGTIYKMTPAGVVTALYEFTSSPDGYYRYPQGLIQGTDGNFYGTTNGSYGMVFKITPQGKLTKLHEFAGYPTEGRTPVGSLIQASDGNFYGATHQGGTYDWGTIYKMTPAGLVTILRNFQEADGLGRLPASGPVQGTDGNFYGGTNGGPHDDILYQITSSGTYNIIYDGFNNTNGTTPNDPLFQHTNGTFYSDTRNGGTGTACLGNGCGVLYSFSMGFGPFVSFVPSQSSGKVGSTIGILGQGFTGTTAVSFNGTSASFKVVSDTYLTATVPSGATIGSVTLTTPGGTLSSNTIFRETPAILSFNPTSGPVGTSVTITGTSFTGATSVAFGGVKAKTFSVNSDTGITATVPTGAKTGKIQVTTPGGTAVSATSFTVTL